MKKTHIITIGILIAFLFSTVSPAFTTLYTAAAASEKPAKFVINNKTEEKFTITFKGTKTYKFKLKANKNKVSLLKGKYVYTYKACGVYQRGEIEITKANQKLILPDSATATGMVQLTIRNKTGAKTSVTLRGPTYYNFKLKANKNEKVYVKKGTYTYTYEACGEKITNTISVQTGKEKLILAKCKKAKGGKNIKVTINNNTHGYITLYLDGPESYYFHLKPGKTTIEVIKGKYQYRAYGCGGASRTGTQNLRNGFKWKWFCM